MLTLTLGRRTRLAQLLYFCEGENLKAFCGIRDAAGQVSVLAPLVNECEGSQSPPEQQQAEGIAQVCVELVYAASIWTRADEDAEGLVFCYPFLVKQPSMDDLAQANLRYMKTLSGVAIFNMGLACHLQYRIADDCQKSEVLANRASTLYWQAANLLEDCSIQPNESVLQVYLAICNNMIEISLSEGYIHQARRWKGKLEECVTKALRSTSTSTSNTVLVHYFRDIQLVYSGTFAAARAA